MSIELFRQDRHVCVMFARLGDEGGDAEQSNQFLLVNGDTGAIVASHADPDIIASLDRWMTATEAPVCISRIGERFAPHFCKPGKTAGRIVGLPDAGERLRLGTGADRFELWALPAHFLHAEGNFQFYDPVSRILFSGDLGASMGTSLNPVQPVTSLAAHIPRMEGFHRRYMVSNKVLRLWAAMVRQLDIQMIAPQHGAPMVGSAVQEFIAWVEQLECGIDLFGAANYRVPG